MRRRLLALPLSLLVLVLAVPAGATAGAHAPAAVGNVPVTPSAGAGAAATAAAAADGSVTAAVPGDGVPLSGSHELADPTVLRVGDAYYAYGTNDWHNFPIYRTTDPGRGPWQRVDTGTDDDRLGPLPRWALQGDQRMLWAPTVAQASDGAFVAYVAMALNDRRDELGQPMMCLAQAVSTTGPAGPFRTTSTDAPFLCPTERNGAIDPSIFTDADGTPYLLWKSQGVMGREATILWTRQLTRDLRSWAPGSVETRLLASDQAWEVPGVENPHMELLDGRYFLFYSGNSYNTVHYAVGYAECNGPLGPCAKPLNRPLLQSHHAVEGPGGSDLFTDARGTRWMVYHAYDRGSWRADATNLEAPRKAHLRPFRLGADGRPQLGDASGAFHPTPRTTRISGPTRFDTAAQFAMATTFHSPSVAYVAYGRDYPDALAAAPAAGREGGAVLLVERDSVPASTRAEIERSKPNYLVIMGGTSVISPRVEQELRELMGRRGAGLHREAGANRFETAARVSANTWRAGTYHGDVRATVAYLAAGGSFPDALAAGAAGAANDGPVLLTTRDALPEPTLRELRRLRDRGLQRVVAIGGGAAIGEPVLEQLRREGLRVERIAGSGRFETAARVAATQFAGPVGSAIVATGQDFADAVVAGAFGAPVLLVPRSGALPAETKAAVEALRPLSVSVVGGPSSVSDGLLAELR